MIQCRKCKNTPNAPAEYIRQTKCALRNRFGEHRRAIQNETTDAVNSKRESIRRAPESFYIDKTKTMQPHGINIEDDY